jgi:RNA polymerase sigma factor (sigma-70 family)
MLSTIPKIRMADAPPPPDDQLLKRFVEGRDEEAFALLVRRHGGIVLGVCRRVAGNTHDAEDAFQATFLVLARRAASVSPTMLAPWLYGVAYRTALKARSAAGRRRGKEQSMAAVPETPQKPQEVDRELFQQLDYALSRLPTKYRTAIILCELEQQPRRQAAAKLKIPEGTLSSRLAAGRRMLAAGLKKAGVTPSIGAVGAALSAQSRSAPAETLVVSTAHTAVRFCAGGAAGVASASAGAVTLAEGILRMMLVKKLVVGLLLFLATASLVGYGAVVYADAKARLAVQKSLEGVWLVESVEDSGDKREAKDYQVIFKGDRFTFKPPGGRKEEMSGRYEVDPDKSPQMIDFIDARDGKPRLGLFILKGDELRICMNEDPDGERPDRIVSVKKQGGSNNDLLMILKRPKARKEAQ